MFSTPQVNIYSADVVRSVELYRELGFHDRLDTLRIAWVADPDDDPSELVQRPR